MSYNAKQDFHVRKAEQTLLDAVQAGKCSDECLLNICNKALKSYHFQILQIKVRRYVPTSETVKKENDKFTLQKYQFLPSVAPICEHFEHMQGFEVYMDEKMYEYCATEQIIFICLLLMVDRELFNKINEFSFIHEVYEAFPSFHKAVTTISQALK